MTHAGIDVDRDSPAPTPTSRAAYWDAVRGLGIVLVVYGHVARGLMAGGILAASPPWTTLDALIYSFHMPLFFFISGRFFPSTFQRQGAVPLLMRKVGTIAYPYCLWSLVQGGLEYAMARYTNHGVRPFVGGILWAPIDQFWFLYALFFVFVAATGIYSLRFHARWALLAVAAALFLTDWSATAWQGYGYVAYYLLFFALGSWSASTGVSRSEWKTLPTGLLAVAGLAALIQFNGLGYPVQVSPLLWQQRLVALACAVAGSGVILCGARVLPRSLCGVVALLGRRSMEIYLLHIIVASGTRILAARFLGMHDPYLHLLLGTSMGLLVPVLMASWLRSIGVAFLFEWPRTLPASST